MAITDNFTDTNGTDLASHVSPGGQTWSSSGSSALTISSNKVVAPNVSNLNSIYEWIIGAVGANLTFSIDFTFPVYNSLLSPSFFFSVTFRGAHPSGYTGVLALVTRSGTDLALQINEDATPLATVIANDIDDGLTHTLTFTAQGNVFRLYVDGVKRLTAYSITYPAQGQTRLNVHGNSSGVPAGFTLDNASLDVLSPQPLTLAPLVSAARFIHNMVPVPPTEFVFLTARHRPVPGALSLGGGGGTPPPIEGQLWPRGQKSG